jgi:hypothetical protein
MIVKSGCVCTKKLCTVKNFHSGGTSRIEGKRENESGVSLRISQ